MGLLSDDERRNLVNKTAELAQKVRNGEITGDEAFAQLGDEPGADAVTFGN